MTALRLATGASLLMLTALPTSIGSPALSASQPPAATAAREEQVQEAVAAVAQANGYSDLLAVLAKYKTVLASPGASDLVARRLREADSAEARRILRITGQLFIDTSKEGSETAADRYLVRLIAASAITTADSDRLERLLVRYYEFSAKMTASLSATALKTLPLDWPPGLPKLMETFLEDWHTLGARQAGHELTAALEEIAYDPTGALAKTRDLSIVGQWYFTHIGAAAEPEDVNLVLARHGVARSYASTGGPEDFEGITSGHWSTKDGVLTIKWAVGDENPTAATSSGRYQLLNGELVWPGLGAKSWRPR